MRSRSAIRTRCSARCWWSSSVSTCAACCKGRGQSRGERLALRLELLLKEALTERWDIARMAGALHFSERPAPSTLSAAFRAGAQWRCCNGCGCSGRRSCWRGRADPVKQLAEQCGFKNEYHFSTAFRRQHGLAPSHYRRLHHPAFKGTLRDYVPKSEAQGVPRKTCSLCQVLDLMLTNSG